MEFEQNVVFGMKIPKIVEVVNIEGETMIFRQEQIEEIFWTPEYIYLKLKDGIDSIYAGKTFVFVGLPFILTFD